jgi:hypothetical protein
MKMLCAKKILYKPTANFKSSLSTVTSSGSPPSTPRVSVDAPTHLRKRGLLKRLGREAKQKKKTPTYWWGWLRETKERKGFDMKVH